jgi:hypothetical protein
MLTAVLLLLAPPGDAQPGEVVQTHDLGTMPWLRAKALDGQRVRVRFTVDHLGCVVGPAAGQVIVAHVVGPEGEGRGRFVTLPKGSEPALTRGARLEAEGVLRVSWGRGSVRGSVYVEVRVQDARLVK